MASSGPLSVSAPGKVILMGEHAVVYGHPAVVAAADLRFRATFGAAPRAGVEIVGLDVEDEAARARSPWPRILERARRARRAWEAYDADPNPARFRSLRSEEPAHLAWVALGEAALRLGEEAGPALRLELSSSIPSGCGLGSSAALAVCVAGGYLWLRDGRPAAEEVEAVAMEVERRQHGHPSGVDVAAVRRGGTLWAERGEDGLELRPLEVDGGLLGRFAIFHTGPPRESTGEVVAAVRERLDRRPSLRGTLDEMGELTATFARLLESGERAAEELVRPIRAFQRALERLGVVPAPVVELARAVEERGGAAKISGAGALSRGKEGRPGAGVLLAYHPEPGRAAGWTLLESQRRLDAPLGAAGMRAEGPSRRSAAGR